MKPVDFVNRYRPFALETEKKKGIHHNFTLAQAAIESGWGESHEWSEENPPLFMF